MIDYVGSWCPLILGHAFPPVIDAIKEGYKTYLIFLVQVQNMENFKIAKDIDKEYYENYLLAKKAGVIFLAYQCKISSKEIKIDKKIKIINA